MTLPTGTISISNINTEVGAAATTARGLDWLNGNVKGFSGYNLNSVKGLTWYQKTNAYNCTANAGGQCEPAFVSGNYNCGAVQSNPLGYDGAGGLVNCTANSACNCACNCDNKAWLQSNCNCGNNCNCAYNCRYTACNCNCACRC